MKTPITVAIALADDVDGDICQQFLTVAPELISSLKDCEMLQQTHHKPGIQLVISNKNQLKEPLKQLQIFTQQHKCDFVIGIITAENAPFEEICFFGHNEGKPDIFEIYCYLTGN